MNDHAGPGAGDETSPTLGDVRFDGGRMLTYDGHTWVPVVRVHDTGPRAVIRAIDYPEDDAKAAGDAPGGDPAGP